MAAEGEGHKVTLEELDNLAKDPRATQDLSGETNEALAQAKQLDEANRTEEAIALLFAVEKKARNAFDGLSGSRLCNAALNMYMEKNDVTKALEVLQTLCKRRLQLKRCITSMVENCMAWKDKCPDMEKKLQIIEVLAGVTEGKIFVEVQRARLLFDLARIKEEEGDLEKSAALLQEVQVETIGGMERSEKAELILHQMRLMLLLKDYIRCQIISQKLPQRTLDHPDFQQVRLQFYSYMVLYNVHEKLYRDVCKCIAKILDTPIVRECQTEPEKLNEAQLRPFLPNDLAMSNINLWYVENYVLFLVLSPREPEQIDLCRLIANNEKKLLQRTPLFSQLLTDFIEDKLIAHPTPYFASLEAHPLLSDHPLENGQIRRDLLCQRIIEHNLCVIAKYYTRIQLKRIAELLNITEERAEESLCKLVSTKTIIAKLDRMTGEVVFGQQKNSTALLHQWTANTAALLDMVDKTSHLLENEKTLFLLSQKRAAAQSRS